MGMNKHDGLHPMVSCIGHTQQQHVQIPAKVVCEHGRVWSAYPNKVQSSPFGQTN